MLCREGNIETVQLLLQHNSVDVNALDCFGVSPLYLAVAREQDEIVRLLLGRQDIDVEAGSKSPLIRASQTGNEQTVQLLLHHASVKFTQTE